MAENDFKFEYTEPWLDWYTIVKVNIKKGEYKLFTLELRCGTWWVIGKNPPPEGLKTYRWTEKQLGRIGKSDIYRFIKWAETDRGGSCINEIRASSNEPNIIREIFEIMKIKEA